MKRIFCFLTILISLSCVYAQTPNDSVKLERIEFNNPYDCSFIKDSVFYLKNFDKKVLKKKLRANPNYKPWRWGVNGGYAVRIAPDPKDLPEGLDSYRKNLRFGPGFGADVFYYTSPNVGVGVKYSLFNTSNSTDHIIYESSEGHTYDGSRSDDIYTHFVGPSIAIRSIPKNNKIYASCDLTLGYIWYNNKINFNSHDFNLKGNNFGFASSIGADFMISNDFSVGLALNITAASIKKLKASESAKIKLSEEEIENLSRVSLVLVFRNYR